ncbi:hypothetical protein Bbelb_053540 [Branchiostoma belcheri]|nr:hypothetical protein Bbelb_053540 [Branchiostoma belcheri]
MKKKVAYFGSKILESRNNPKDLWRTLNEMIGRGRQRSACAVKQEGVILTKGEAIADTFITFPKKVYSLRAGIGSQVNVDDWYRKVHQGNIFGIIFLDFSAAFDLLPCVMQGSCLGPLLFTIYTNDLPLAVTEATPAMYADDTSAYASAPTIQNATSIL